MLDQDLPHENDAGPSDNGPPSEISLWPSGPNKADLAVGAGHAAPTRNNFDGKAKFKKIYYKDEAGEEHSRQIPEDEQVPVNVLGRTIEDAASTLPRYKTQSPSPPNSPNRFKFPGSQPPQSISNLESVQDEPVDRDRATTDHLIPPIAAIVGDNSVPRLQPAGWDKVDGRSANQSTGVTNQPPTSMNNRLSLEPQPPSNGHGAHDSVSEPTESTETVPAAASPTPTEKSRAPAETYRVIARGGVPVAPRLVGRKDILGTPPTAMSSLRLQDDGSSDGGDSSGRPVASSSSTVPAKRQGSPQGSDDGDGLDPDDDDSKPKKKRKSVGRYKCDVAWCNETFTRRGDVQRHLKNAAVHRDKTNPAASDKRCKFCNSDLSRSDARARHERAGACGKRSLPRKEQKGGVVIQAENQASAPEQQSNDSS